MSRKRFIPHLDRGVKVWITRYAMANQWRVRNCYDLDDLIQEGFMIFCRVMEKYDGRIKNQAHLMRLIQVSFKNHITDLAKQRSRDPDQYPLPTPPIDHDGMMPISEYWLLSDDGATARMTELIMHGPKELAAVLSALHKLPAKKLQSSYRRNGASRETTNQRLCRLAGLDPNTDVCGIIRDYLTV